MPETLVTEDLFLAAFLICQGGRVAELEVEDPEEPARLTLFGEGLGQHALDYRTGAGWVSALFLKEELSNLHHKINQAAKAAKEGGR